MSQVSRGVHRNSQLLPEVTGGIKVLCERGSSRLVQPHCLPAAGSGRMDWEQRGWRNTELPRPAFLTRNNLWETGKFPQSEAFPLQLGQLTVCTQCWAQGQSSSAGRTNVSKGFGWRKVGRRPSVPCASPSPV